MLINDQVCEHCNTETIIYEEKHHIMVCSVCGLVLTEIEKKIENQTERELLNIKMKVNKILSEFLPLLNIHRNVEKSIRKKMLSIVRKNKDIGKLKNVECVVMTLVIYAIRDLKIPLNKQKVNITLKRYIDTNILLKELGNLRI